MSGLQTFYESIRSEKSLSYVKVKDMIVKSSANAKKAKRKQSVFQKEQVFKGCN